MNTFATISQCASCLRFFSGFDLVELTFPEQLAALREGRLQQEFDCGRADCAAVVARRQEREQAACRRSAQRELERRADKKAARPVPREKVRRREVPERGLDRSRLPYPDAELAEVPVPAPSPAPVTNVGAEVEKVLTVNTFGQRDFEASGAARAAKELLIDWFKQPKHFQRWFTKKFLEDVVMQGRSGCCNNRAIDCREYFVPAGLYIDNKMIKVDGRVLSHYALVRIEDAVSLTPEQKAKLIGTI